MLIRGFGNYLVVEYVATYTEKKLLFNFFDRKKLLSSFVYEISGDKDIDKLSAIYKQFITSKGLRPFKACKLIISSFDTAVSNMTMKKTTIFTSNLIKNFLLDNYGDDYEEKYFLNRQRADLKNGFILHSFFGCHKSKIKEIQIILYALGIKRFQISFIGQYLNAYIKRFKKLNNCYLMYKYDDYSILACAKSSQIVLNLFVCRQNDEYKQLTKIDNLLISLDKFSRKDGNDYDNLYLIGNEDSDDIFKYLELSVISLPAIAHEKLISLPLHLKYVVFNPNEKPKKKKSSFDWQKFLGIKKGFTLAESIVSIAIFAVIATITATFILTSTNINENTKKSVIARSYLNNMCETFNNDPSEDNVKIITKYESEDLIGNRHFYYLDSQMDFAKSSSSPIDMTYQVLFEYDVFSFSKDEYIAQDYHKYVFTIFSIHLINTTSSCIDETAFTVVR